MISEKVNQIGASPTLKISAKARAMKAEGIDIVDLSVGEPDFPTPENIKAAGIRAIQQNFTKYTENEGTPALKKAIIARMKEDYGLSYELNEVIVSSGAKNSLFNLIEALVNEGEEVIIPAPYWVTYPQAVAIAGGKPVYVPTKEENEFLLSPEELRAAINPATKALVLNNPSGRRDLYGPSSSPGGSPGGHHHRRRIQSSSRRFLRELPSWGAQKKPSDQQRLQSPCGLADRPRPQAAEDHRIGKSTTRPEPCSISQQAASP
jgi:hypothetical protein